MTNTVAAWLGIPKGRSDASSSVATEPGLEGLNID
jgi:hypothetical protein